LKGLKQARKAAGMRQTELAAAMDVNQPTISMWENGGSAPIAEKLPKLARILGCTIDDLFKEDKQV